MKLLLAAALVWIPRVDAGIEATHDLGLNDQLRGTIRLMLDMDVVADRDWALSVFHETRTFVRRNNPETESAFRISPEQVHFPVGARLRFNLETPGHTWGLVAFHQSNHDVDSSDVLRARETVAYELYGAEYSAPWGAVWGGVLYDRGTRVVVNNQGEARVVPQILPFDYYLAGLIAQTQTQFWRSAYVGGRLAVFAHLGDSHAPPYVNLDGWVDIGWRLTGMAGVWNLFFRFQRIEDYQHLGDEPQHLLLLGTSIRSG